MGGRGWSTDACGCVVLNLGLSGPGTQHTKRHRDHIGSTRLSRASTGACGPKPTAAIDRSKGARRARRRDQHHVCLVVGQLARDGWGKLDDVVIVISTATSPSGRGHEDGSSGRGTLAPFDSRERVTDPLEERFVGLVDGGLAGHLGLLRCDHILSLPEMSTENVTGAAVTTTTTAEAR